MLRLSKGESRSPMLVALLVFLAAAVILFALLRKTRAALSAIRTERDALRSRFAPVLDVEAEIARLRNESNSELARVAGETSLKRQELDRVSVDYGQARALYESLRKQIELLEENIEDISVGLYKPHFDFDTSEQFKTELSRLNTEQKRLVRDGLAIHFGVEWVIGGDRKAGARMQKQYSKLLLRAFNGECEAAIAKVAWNNVTRMEERINSAFGAINAMGEVMQIAVTPLYLSAKLKELRLEYEYERKRKEEQDEQRAIREQMREEERAQRELERAKAEAAAEEARELRALEKARTELAKAKGAEIAKYEEMVRELEARLESTRARERALSQAQITKSGHVYVISNIGSFGDDVFKIGMTRRLEPMERVKELGDASVPFDFDVHAMIYSNDAPRLESEFHKRFVERRVNLVNERKEFFRVSLSEIEAFARTQGAKVEFTRLAAAKDFRESEAIRASRVSPKAVPSATAAFPDRLPVSA